MSSTNWNPKPNTVPEYEVQDVTGFVDLFGELEGHSRQVSDWTTGIFLRLRGVICILCKPP